jgi:tRNA threonylcarbamoyladenosine biosynthesis protein TsaE
MQEREGELIFSNVSIAELADVCKRLLSAAAEQRIWIFVGEMGAGKTTLIKELGRQLHVLDTMSSPTFSIINEYRIAQNANIFHFDFYRIKNEAEAVDIGVEDYLYSGNYCFVEWPEKIPSLLPDVYCKVKIETSDIHFRTIVFSTHG